MARLVAAALLLWVPKWSSASKSATFPGPPPAEGKQLRGRLVQYCTVPERSESFFLRRLYCFILFLKVKIDNIFITFSLQTQNIWI